MLLRLFIFTLLLFSSTAWANKRVALVIGNSDYKKLSTLPNPVRDAVAMEKALRKLDFEVTLEKNLDRKEMSKVIRDFSAKLKKDDVGLFYYAGHSVEVGGTHYLLPLDVSTNTPTEVDDDSIKLDGIIQKMGSVNNDINIMILDACRNNPFPKYRNLQNSSCSENAQSFSNIFIAHATTEGKKSLDGEGKNGLFTHYLLKNIATPNIYIEDMFKKIAEELKEESEKFGYQQIPWTNASLLKKFCFNCFNQEESDKEKNKNKEGKAIDISVRKLHPIPEMVSMPKGTFKMGCDKKMDVHCMFEPDEQPIYEVTIAPFSIGKYEVTFDEWDACVKAKVCDYKSDHGWGRGKRPVMGISWDDTQDFIKWLRDVTQQDYRLPTEAEWEYAAKIGRQTQYPWGYLIGSNNANCAGCGSQSKKRTLPVGSFPAFNKLHDMNGNVAEWVQDCYHRGYKDAPKNGSEWKGDCYKDNNASLYKILRGGSWSDEPRLLRSTYRRFLPNNRQQRQRTNGFRVAKTP